MEFNFMKLLPLYATPSSTITSLFFSVYVSIFFCSHTELEAAAMNPSQNLSYPAFFSFGDSIVDTGNNNNLTTTAKCNFPPYGRDFMGGKPTGRFSNGKTPPDLIVETLGIKEILPAYLDPNLQIKDLYSGVNFASGGCGFDPLTSEITTAYSLSDQIDFFKDYIVKLRDNAGEERANSIISRSVYLVAASANDIETTYFNSNIRRLQYRDNYPSYVSFLITQASNFFKELYGLGARNFLILSAPPLGCLPSTITVAGRGSRKECIEKYNQAAQLFNTKLSAEIDSLNNTLPQSRLVYVDIYYSLLDIIQNPNKYGFEIVDRGCCGTGTIEVTLTCNELSPVCEDVSKYIFWDSFHPTERTYKIVVSILRKKILNSLSAPSN
ncbi:hypothetical protein EZV62_021187 [Acer yangbiense]|uniref:Uncharacterized protein n=1 Tax=Acer yangbiense TaxID=1000413 RepID=A0A5C7H4T7_9ROSI|nr:hypothetical protein EZV62_021187 [Acer yangbiense]